MKSFIATTLFLCAFPSLCDANQPPNIIYILADDAGYGDLSCYGGRLPTPHLDRMAAEGMRFTQHYAGATVCAPSRCVLLTGLHTGHCRVRGNAEGSLTDDDFCFAQMMKAGGYATACIGKWGVGNPPPIDDPERFGFENFYGYISMFHAHNFYPEFLIRNGKRVALQNVVADRWKGGDGRGVAVKRVDYAPFLLSDEVIRFLEAERDQPFLLYYALNLPHANNEASRAMTELQGMEVPDLGEYADKDWPGPEKGFAAVMKNIDRDVGRILAKLKELGLDGNTLVLFSSDNGPHQEGGHTMEFFDSNGKLRGMKRDLYEGGVRVPLIARWPGKIGAGSVSDHISGFQDVLPTLAEIAGLEAPECDGVSFAPTLLGQPHRQTQHPYLYWEFTERGGKRALRQGKWKVVQQSVSAQSPEDPELYDLSVDVGESNNLAAQHPDVVKRLVQLMDEAHTPSKVYPLFASERAPKS